MSFCPYNVPNPFPLDFLLLDPTSFSYCLNHHKIYSVKVTALTSERVRVHKNELWVYCT